MAPVSTSYKIECWGASGREFSSGAGTGIPGKGGYSKGIISLAKDKVLYVYVGEQGTSEPASNEAFRGGWNGGGYGYGGSGGGGASDVRIIRHTENDGWSGINSLRSRIIVAAGGGGCNSYDGGNLGGFGGGLVGGFSEGRSYSRNEFRATGATQTQGGIDPVTNGTLINYTYSAKINSGKAIYSGTFGYANIPFGESIYWGGGGGGGWYGGGVGHGQGGSGGSSFVSGMEGCVAMSSTGTQDPNINYQTINGTSYIFTSATTVDGGSVMPKPRGGAENGHFGDGYIMITWFSPSLQP